MDIMSSRPASIASDAVLAAAHTPELWRRAAGSAVNGPPIGQSRLRDPVEFVRVGPGTFILVQCGDRGDIGICELEVKEGEVLLDPATSDRLREHDVTPLDMPTQGDLRCRLANTVGYRSYRGVAQNLALRDGRPCFGENTVIAIERTHVILRKKWMDLNLVDGRDNPCLVKKTLKMMRLEVGDANRLDPTGSVYFLHCLPGFHVVSDRGKRPVDEEQVQIVEAECVHGAIECCNGVFASVEPVVQLARYVDVAAVYARLTDGLAEGERENENCGRGRRGG